MYLMLALMGIIPLIVAGQVIRLGMLDTGDLREKGARQAETEIVIPALRGSILDAKNRVLAGDKILESIALDPTAKGFRAHAMRHYRVLSEVTGMSVNKIDHLVRNRRSNQYLLLSRDAHLNLDLRAAVEAIPGASVRKRYARFYNYASSGPHLRGYVDVDMRGLEGLEKQYDDLLSGVPGFREARRDRRGVRKMIPGGEVVEPRHGQTLKLTVDIVRQTIMEEELAAGTEKSGARWAVAIAMDPRTGAIIAMANAPTFDINNPGAAPAENRKNGAIVNRFEPGSTFKLIAAVAAIETGVVAMSDTFDTGVGYARIAGWPVRDTHGHGSIPFTEVISLSSNIGFAQLSERLDGGSYYQYARSLGFGQTSGIDLPGEESGKLRKPASWSRSTLSSMSRGYGVDVTPLQVLTAYSALANGGLLVKPYLVAERLDIAGNSLWQASTDSIRRAFSKETAATLLPAFEAVVNSGTAKTARVQGIRIAGKTGTAKKVENGSYRAGKYRASFVGFFPAEDPRIAMIVVMDEPRSSIYGGYTAAPVFKRIAERWLPTFPEIHRDELLAEVPEADSLASIPDVTGLPYSVARRKMAVLGFRPSVSGTIDPGQEIVSQRPVSGESGYAKEKIRLSVARTASVADSPGPRPGADAVGSVHVPDVRGLSARDATYLLRNRGFNTRIQGSGIVVSQTPHPGATRSSDVVLRLN